MEPVHPMLREELKRAHPGLADDDIDRYQELTARRFAFDPDRDREEIRRIDVQREALIRERMPRFADVEQAFVARQREASRRERTPPRIELCGRGDTQPR
jgi:hypothetical protein